MKLFSHVRIPSVKDEDGVVSWATKTPSTADDQNKPSSEGPSRGSSNRHVLLGGSALSLTNVNSYRELNTLLRVRREAVPESWGTRQKTVIRRQLEDELEQVRDAAQFWRGARFYQKTPESRAVADREIERLERRIEQLEQEIEELG